MTMGEYIPRLHKKYQTDVVPQLMRQFGFTNKLEVPRLQKEIVARGGPATLRILTPGPTPAETYGHLLAPADGEPESWVVVDQFEEVFTLCRDDAKRVAFFDRLLALRAERPVVLTMRADFWGDCAPYPALRGRSRNDLPPHLAWMQWR